MARCVDGAHTHVSSECLAAAAAAAAAAIDRVGGSAFLPRPGGGGGGALEIDDGSITKRGAGQNTSTDDRRVCNWRPVQSINS